MVEISAPIQFSNPQILTCVLNSKPVLCDSNRVTDKLVLQTESGRFYEIGRPIRETIFGHVSHALELRLSHGDILVRMDPLQHVAVKVYMRQKLRELSGRTQENPVKEMAAMQFLRLNGNHQNIIRHIECCADAERVFSLMEFVEAGELYDIVASNTSLEEGLARYYFRQIINGMQYLHSLPICHRKFLMISFLIKNKNIFFR